MALVLGVVDADGSRRDHVRAHLPQSLSGLPHLARQDASFGALDLYWESSASTPVSIARDDTRERFAFVVGDFDAPYRVPSDAGARLLRSVAGRAIEPRDVGGRNGYYFAVVCDDAGRLTLGNDTLGLFPLYYWARGDVCLFGTSPELFRLHPAFVAAPSLYGIASVLLVNHIGGGRSLWEGVLRPAVGRCCVFVPGEGAREHAANPAIMSDARFDAPYEACREEVTSQLDGFHAALKGIPRVDLFLSGGQDSRTLAGYADRRLGRDVMRAVSLGIEADQELRYARQVSRALGWTHRHRDVEFERYPWFAATQVRMESLQGPFASFDTRTALPMLAERGGPFLSGYFGDPIVGDGQVLHATSPRTGEIEFATHFQGVNGYGFSRADAVALLGSREGAHAVDAVIEDLARDWDAPDVPRFQKAWWFAMTHRVRMHVGSIVWRLSLGAWPILPYCDRRLLDLVASLPLSHLRGRRMQADIIKREFPRLATLPLDRNAVGPEYLVTPLYRKFIPPLSELSWRAHRLLERDRERRYYHRTYDFNAPGWRAVRSTAEPYRARLRELLDPAAVDRLLPAADARPRFENAVRDASPVKTLVGLAMWYGTNF